MGGCVGRAPNLACPADARSIDDLRVADVGRAREVWARRALPRWPNKRALVLAALGSLTTHALPASTGDSAEDVLALVEEIATAVASPQARLMMTLLVGPDKELAEALRAANLAPQLEHLRERLRAALGDVDDLNARTELGPALISFRGLVLGRKVTFLELREDILPQLLRSS